MASATDRAIATTSPLERVRPGLTIEACRIPTFAVRHANTWQRAYGGRRQQCVQQDDMKLPVPPWLIDTFIK